MKQDIDSAEVAAWLQANPEFFNEQAELLSRLRLVSPVIGKTISLHDRQIEVIREKNKGLERNLAELIRIARDNDTLLRHIQKWTRAILKSNSDADRPRTLISELQSIFTIPHATLRLWNLDETYADKWFTQDVSESIRIFAQGLQAPYCGKNNDYEASRWLKAEAIASIALVPLRTETGTFGLLVLGSPDETRFRADMATDFLSEIAQTASAALICLMA